MATGPLAQIEGTALSSANTEEKDTIKFYAHGGGLPSTQASSRIPAAFVDTPRFPQAPLIGTNPAPPLVANSPASLALPPTVSTSVYLRPSAPAKTVNSEDGFVSGPAEYVYVSGSQESWGANKTPSKEVKSFVGAQGLQTFRASLPPTGYTTRVGASCLSCPLEVRTTATVENFLADPPSETVAAVPRYQLPGPAVRKVLPMREVGYCTDYHGRSRVGLQPSVATVSHLVRDYPKVLLSDTS